MLSDNDFDIADILLRLYSLHNIMIVTVCMRNSLINLRRLSNSTISLGSGSVLYWFAKWCLLSWKLCLDLTTLYFEYDQ